MYAPVTSPSSSTLFETLRARAQHQPGQTAYTYLADADGRPASLTYAALDTRARALGALLQEVTAAGERALLLFPPGLDYITSFFGCLYAGVVAVPAYPPNPARLRQSMPRLRALARDARPAVALTTSAIMDARDALLVNEPELRAVRWLATDALPEEQAAAWKEPELTAATLAFLQYTSGSTSTPRGVMLTHGNLVHNLELIRDRLKIGPEDRWVSWLPPYHDMGLIGGLLSPLQAGIPSVFLSPFAFLQQPLRWLQAISQFRGTISGAPNFAYDLCARKIPPERRAALDLDCWQIAFNGAEPVRAETIDRFTAAFSARGFRREAFLPCYGLAEGTLMVSGEERIAPPRFVWLEASALEQHRVSPSAPSLPGARALVACGRACGDQRVEIVDPESRVRCPDRRIGEIWVSGSSVAQGYWERPEDTERTLRARLAESGEGPFLRTGDLGFFHDGQLVITGRIKDLIILDGRNHYPQDLEATAEQAHPAIRPGCCAVFSVEAEGQERTVLAAEVAIKEGGLPVDTAALVRELKRAVSAQHELHLHEVLLLKPGGVPKTSSGKVQRSACRQAYLHRELELLEATPS